MSSIEINDRDYHTGLNNTLVPAAEDVDSVPGGSELPLHPYQQAAEPDDAGTARSELTPVNFPTPAAANETDVVRELKSFAAFIAAMKEEDYGDWMRRANTYWMHLDQSLARSQVPDRALVGEMLKELQEQIQYCPDFKVPETQRLVIASVNRMLEQIGAHGDLEPHLLRLPETLASRPEIHP